MITEAKILTAGSCGQNEKITNTTKPFHHIQFPAHFFFIKHKTKGNILVDTGYSHHFLEETASFPYNIYAKLTPVQFKREDNALEQLKRMGIEKETITYIFISHFHADHIAGLRDFPNATFICSKKAYEFVRNKNGISALKQAFIPNLLPKNFNSRVMFIEEQSFADKTSDLTIRDLSPNGVMYDLFGDGSLLSMDLTGHANGQYGLFFEINNKKVWLIADATWDSDSYKHYQLPSSIANLIQYDAKSLKRNIKHIHDYYQKHQDVLIVPSHCRTIKEEWERKI